MRLRMCTVLLCSLLAGMFASCRGQAHASSTNSPAGDTVSQLGKSILIIYQSRNNNYWFGSGGEGVYRYDGKTLVHFSTKDGLADNRIRQILEDRQGHIFINTSGGISKFDGKQFTTLPVAKSGSEWKLSPDDLWFSSNQNDNGPYRYDGKTLYQLQFPMHYLEGEFYKDNPAAPYSPYQVYSVYKDSKGSIWLGTSTLGVCRYDGKSLSWLYEKHLTQIGEDGSFGIRSMVEDGNGKFWFCNTKYRYTINPQDSAKGFIGYQREKGIDGLVAPDGNNLIYYMSVAKDNKNDLWMATHGFGVWRYDGLEVMHYPVKDGDKDVTVYSIYKDNRGDLWLGTHDAGAYRFNGMAFERFRL